MCDEQRGREREFPPFSGALTLERSVFRLRGLAKHVTSMAELCVHLDLTSAGAAVSSIGGADWLGNPPYQTFSLRTLPDGLTLPVSRLAQHPWLIRKLKTRGISQTCNTNASSPRETEKVVRDRQKS